MWFPFPIWHFHKLWSTPITQDGDVLTCFSKFPGGYVTGHRRKITGATVISISLTLICITWTDQSTAGSQWSRSQWTLLDKFSSALANKFFAVKSSMALIIPFSYLFNLLFASFFSLYSSWSVRLKWWSFDSWWKISSHFAMTSQARKNLGFKKFYNYLI